MDAGKIVFQGEMQLAGWNESHSGGAKVVLWLSDPSELDAFRAMTARKGNMAGQRLGVVMVEIGPDEQPVEQAPSVMPRKPGGDLSKLAAIWCHAPDFQRWLCSNFTDEWAAAEARIEGASDDEIAAEVVRTVCGCKSRAELDHDDAAALRFNERIRQPFAATL